MSGRNIGTVRKAYLLVMAPGAERSRMSEYLDGLPRLQARAGGRMLALESAVSVEHYGHGGEPRSLMLSAWNDIESLLAFWHSPEHQQPSACGLDEDLLAIVLEGELDADCAHAESFAIFLGPGPSPALLEAEGACALALVRERAVGRLRGAWDQGDVAIYAWASAVSARRPMLSFSSGQRGHGLLVPALQFARRPPLASLRQQRAAA